MAVERVILRFRDLVTDPGETIASHRGLIAEYTYAWWAWWNKMGEKVPTEVFSALARRITEEGPLTLYLMDSGQELLYTATCSQVVWGLDLQPMPSPEAEKTPAYYRTRPYRAWFKLSEINEAPETDAAAVLNSLAYVRVDEFFTSGVSNYNAFYEKRIHSVSELRQQDRTMWFVRAAEQGDPMHEVALFGATTTMPRDFVLQPIEADARTFLWLSDLHFDAEGANHGFALAPQHGLRTLAGGLEEDLKALGIEQLGGAIVSGDLTWQATDDDYAFVKGFLRSVQSWARLPDPATFVVCPGNHDLAFSGRPAEKSDDVTVALPQARDAYERFYGDFFHRAPNEFLAMGRRYLIRGSRIIDIVALNSSLLQQHKGMFQGQGYVSDEQLGYVAREIGWDEQGIGDRAYRVLVLHHHLMPVVHREIPIIGHPYSLTLDAGAVLRWAVSHRIDLILHGHMHEPYCGIITLPIKSLGALGDVHTMGLVALGSTGVGPEHRSSQNLFGLLDFGPDGVIVKMFQLAAGAVLNPANDPFLERTFAYTTPE